MSSRKTYLFFLGGRFKSPLPTIQYLIINLAKFKPVLCFEYPQFVNLIDLIFFKKKLVYRLSKNLTVYKSFGIFPYGRSFYLINLINHFINYIIFNLFFSFNYSKFKIITITPELYFFLRLKKVGINDITYFVEENYTSVPYWPNKFQKNQFKALENKFLPLCKRVISNSQPIFEKYRKLHNKVFLFSQPSNTSTYLKFKLSKAILPADMQNIPKPIAGFIGSFFDWKVDMSLFSKLLDYFPDISFVIIGLTNLSHKSLNEFIQKKNFYYLGYRTKIELPYLISNFDICLIPYSTTKARYAFPTKIYEYLALGKPIVTTALPSIKHLSRNKTIYWSKNNYDFIRNVSGALKEKNSNVLIEHRRHLAQINSWENRIREFISLSNK